jgi:hypothetical protein
MNRNRSERYRQTEEKKDGSKNKREEREEVENKGEDSEGDESKGARVKEVEGRRE